MQNFSLTTQDGSAWVFAFGDDCIIEGTPEQCERAISTIQGWAGTQIGPFTFSTTDGDGDATPDLQTDPSDPVIFGLWERKEGFLVEVTLIDTTVGLATKKTLREAIGVCDNFWNAIVYGTIWLDYHTN